MSADPRLLTPEQLALFTRTPHAVMNHIAALEQQRAEALVIAKKLTHSWLHCVYDACDCLRGLLIEKLGGKE